MLSLRAGQLESGSSAGKACKSCLPRRRVSLRIGELNLGATMVSPRPQPLCTASSAVVNARKLHRAGTTWSSRAGACDLHFRLVTRGARHQQWGGGDNRPPPARRGGSGQARPMGGHNLHAELIPQVGPVRPAAMSFARSVASATTVGRSKRRSA